MGAHAHLKAIVAGEALQVPGKALQDLVTHASLRGSFSSRFLACSHTQA